MDVGRAGPDDTSLSRAGFVSATQRTNWTSSHKSAITPPCRDAVAACAATLKTHEISRIGVSNSFMRPHR